MTKEGLSEIAVKITAEVGDAKNPAGIERKR